MPCCPYPRPPRPSSSPLYLPISPYISLHLPTSPYISPEQLTARLTQLAALGEDAPIFLEATMYSRTHAVIQCGYYADAPTTAEERGPTLTLTLIQSSP